MKNSVALVRERTVPTERPPPVGEVSANFVNHYTICIEKMGVSVEKRYTLHLSYTVVHEVINKFATFFDPVSYLPYNNPGNIRELFF